MNSAHYWFSIQCFFRDGEILCYMYKYVQTNYSFWVLRWFSVWYSSLYNLFIERFGNNDCLLPLSITSATFYLFNNTIKTFKTYLNYFCNILEFIFYTFQMFFSNSTNTDYVNFLFKILFNLLLIWRNTDE